MTLTTQIYNHLRELLTKQRIVSRSLMQLRGCCDTAIVRALVDCKSRRLHSFAYDLEAVLLRFGELAYEPKRTYNQRQFAHSYHNQRVSDNQIMDLINGYESMLLSIYSGILANQELPVYLNYFLRKQRLLINRSNHSISRLLPDIIQAKVLTAVV